MSFKWLATYDHNELSFDVLQVLAVKYRLQLW
jgi:hypothetical protein